MRKLAPELTIDVTARDPAEVAEEIAACARAERCSRAQPEE
jgi:hypothetical protein